MIYEFAPMEGITGYIYRRAHHECFGGVERYFTPFLTPKPGKSLTNREKNDILPAHNQGIPLVPQILTNQAEGFLKIAGQLEELGYREVNLNLGCPSGTVVAKGKGAGFLAEPARLDAFLEEIFSRCPLAISVKTRIGKEEPEEFERLLQIFNRYPIKELIIHPRTQIQFYRGQVCLEAFGTALERSKNPVCYNGDLFTAGRIADFKKRFPGAKQVMLGRGLLVNPALALGALPERERLKAFHDRLVEDYREVLSGERDVLFKMKELMSYQIRLFEDGEKEAKRIRKAQTLAEYRSAVAVLFDRKKIAEPADFLF